MTADLLSRPLNHCHL